jgi:hypothetical protein
MDSTMRVIIGILALIIVMYLIYHLFYGAIYRRSRAISNTESRTGQRFYYPMQKLKRRMT